MNQQPILTDSLCTVKPSWKELGKQYAIIFLIFPALAIIAPIIEILIQKRIHEVNYYTIPLIQFSLFGVGLFILMVILTIPSLRKEKLLLEDEWLTFFSSSGARQKLKVSEITAVMRQWGSVAGVSTGKIQILVFTAGNEQIRAELKKYAYADIQMLVSKLQGLNPQVRCLLDTKQPIIQKILFWFSGK